MSVEAPMGGMSVQAGAPAGPAMGGASFSGEMGSAQSFAGSSLGMEANGGSFSPGVNMAGLFSETSQFSASLGSVPEGPVKGIADSFSREGDWAILATGDKTSPSLHADVLMETTPFIAVESNVSERLSPEQARDIFSSNDWGIFAKAKETLEMKPGEWISTAPKDAVKESAVSADSMADLFSVTKLFSPETPQREGLAEIDINKLGVATETQIIEEAEAIPAEDYARADKVAELLAEVGVYSKDEAKQKVEEIVREVNGIATDSKPAVKGSVETRDSEVQSDMPEAENADSPGAIDVAQTQADAIEDTTRQDKNKKYPPQNKFVLTTYAVDDKAQEQRRISFKANAREVFNRAAENGQEAVGMQEIAGIDEEPGHKSELLFQAGLSSVPDGSFKDVEKGVAAIGEVKNTPEAKQQAMDAIEQEIDRNVAVKTVEGVAAKPASEDDAQKVLKFVKSPVASSHTG